MSIQAFTAIHDALRELAAEVAKLKAEVAEMRAAPPPVNLMHFGGTEKRGPGRPRKEA